VRRVKSFDGNYEILVVQTLKKRKLVGGEIRDESAARVRKRKRLVVVVVDGRVQRVDFVSVALAVAVQQRLASDVTWGCFR